jgi:hypothetical protein
VFHSVQGVCLRADEGRRPCFYCLLNKKLTAQRSEAVPRFLRAAWRKRVRFFPFKPKSAASWRLRSFFPTLDAVSPCLESRGIAKLKFPDSFFY